MPTIYVCVYIFYIYFLLLFDAAIIMLLLHMKVSRFVAVFNQSIKGFCF